MFNFTEQIGRCGHKVLVSHDELQIIGVPPCLDCDNQTAKFIRHKAVYGFYDIPGVTDQIVEAIMNKEFERREFPRLVLKK